MTPDFVGHMFGETLRFVFANEFFLARLLTRSTLKIRTDEGTMNGALGVCYLESYAA
jgi:hypothetical protein